MKQISGSIQPKIVAIIQARMGSSRFKGKILKKIYDKSLLEHIIERVKESTLLNSIVVATTQNKDDDVLIDLLKKNNILYFRGSESNVLERYYLSAIEYKADIIVRITADDPFKDPIIIDKAIQIILDYNYDFVSNAIHPTYPEGIDVEVFTFDSLEKAYKASTLNSEKEHVTPYMEKNPLIFKTHNFEHNQNLSGLRWTIDYEKDYLYAKKIYHKLYPLKKIFLMNDILNLIKNNKHYQYIRTTKIKEGYLKSVQEEENLRATTT